EDRLILHGRALPRRSNRLAQALTGRSFVCITGIINSKFRKTYKMHPFRFSWNAYLILSNQAATDEENANMLMNPRETRSAFVSKPEWVHRPRGNNTLPDWAGSSPE
ncbi:hypothetical protein AAII07_31370, partial [Microvirga sp. 0TCS3.31]